jgi:uncharacterized membrane protein
VRWTLPEKIEKALLGTGIVATGAILTAWCARALARKPAAGSAQSVRAIFDAAPPFYVYLAAGAGAALIIGALVRRRSLIAGRTLSVLAIAALMTIAAIAAFPHGQHAAILTLALGVATLISAQLGARDPDAPIDRRRDRALAIAAWAIVAATHALFSMHRYYWMGAGSWDMGCMIHNLYRASRFLDTTSTVLGEVDFLGDHFMVGLYLYSPLAWIHSSGYTMLAIQSASLAATAPVIFLLARDRGAALAPALALAFAAALGFGMQSGAYFDAHEITIGFGFLAFGVLFFEREKFVAATICFVLFSLFKESLGAYVIALGLLALWRGLKKRDRRHLIYGTGWVLYGAIWFVLVNRVFMPALIARARPPEPHETFADFGPTVFQALIGIATHPLEALGALFVPAEKVSSQLVTFGGLGFLALASPELLLAAAPLFAERFLSSKHTMWEMGYHYAAPLTFYSAWAAAIGWPKIARAAERALAFLSEELRGRSAAAIAIYVLAAGIMTNAAGYRHAANYHHWMEDYFSIPERRETNAKAIALIASQGREARVAVQNRMLPHLADRPWVYRLGEHAKADFVLLNLSESAWPYDDGFPRRLVNQLGRDPAWRLVFSEGETAVFARREKTDLPAVSPAPPLGLPRPDSGAP